MVREEEPRDRHLRSLSLPSWELWRALDPRVKGRILEALTNLGRDDRPGDQRGS